MRKPPCWRYPPCGGFHTRHEECKGGRGSGALLHNGSAAGRRKAVKEPVAAGSSPVAPSSPGVAQKVERRHSKSEVAGSSPRRPVQGARMSVLGCRVCGKAIVQPETGRKRLTCSEKCRTAKSRRGRG